VSDYSCIASSADAEDMPQFQPHNANAGCGYQVCGTLSLKQFSLFTRTEVSSVVNSDMALPDEDIRLSSESMSASVAFPRVLGSMSVESRQLS
jgi:hypothetical protein